MVVDSYVRTYVDANSRTQSSILVVFPTPSVYELQVYHGVQQCTLYMLHLDTKGSSIINARRACSRVTVVSLSVCLSVCLLPI